MILRFLLFSFMSAMVLAKPYRGGELRTHESFRYGRYEVKMKSAPGSGVVSSFFTFRDYWADGLSGSQHWNEIDWEYLGLYNDQVQTNYITQHEWSHVDMISTNFNPHDDFHVYAFEWTPDYLAFFVDDNLVRYDDMGQVDSLYHYQKIMMNIWQPTNVDWVGPFSASILPVYAYYDWVKYYAYVPGTGNAGTDNNFIQMWVDPFDESDTARWGKATHTFDGNNVDFIHENVVFMSGYMILCLTTSNAPGYHGDPLIINDIEHPADFNMHKAFPNPFNSEIVIPISLKYGQSVNLSIYSILGELIHTLVQGNIDAGRTIVTWNGLTNKGFVAPAGIYLVRLTSGDQSKTQKILLLK